MRTSPVFVSVTLALALAILSPSGAEADGAPSGWQKICSATGANQICMVRDTIEIGRDDPAAFLIRPRQGDYLAVASLPALKLDFFKNQNWQIDDGKVLNVPYTKCDRTGCAAMLAANQAFFDALQKGTAIIITGYLIDGTKVSAAFPLKGFAEAYLGSKSMSLDEYKKTAN